MTIGGLVVLAVLGYAALHVLGALFGHHRKRRHGRAHGLRPNFGWSMRRGWWGAITPPVVHGRYYHRL
jgi:hypothetical protein